MRQEQLERLGWHFHRIWSTDWFYAKEKAVEKVIAAYERAPDEPYGVGMHEVSASPMLASVKSDDQSLNSTAERIRSRPYSRAGLDIDDYGTHQLVQLVRWIESDHVSRTEDEVVSMVMSELGFQRRGKHIVAVIMEAITRARV